MRYNCCRRNVIVNAPSKSCNFQSRCGFVQLRTLMHCSCSTVKTSLLLHYFLRACWVPQFILPRLNCTQLLRTWLAPSRSAAPFTIHKCVLGCSLTLHFAGLVCSDHVCRNMRGFYCSRRLLFSPPRCVVLFAHLCGNQGLKTEQFIVMRVGIKIQAARYPFLPFSSVSRRPLLPDGPVLQLHGTSARLPSERQQCRRHLGT